MPKKLKLDLNDLKVTSFVTSLDNKVAAEVKGGNSDPTCPPGPCEPSYEPVTCETCNTCATECTCNPTCLPCITDYWKEYTCAQDCSEMC